MSELEKRLGLIGGTGPQGQGIALRLAKAGYKVMIGSRNHEKAQSIAKELNQKLSSNNIEGSSNQEVVKTTKILLVTIPYETVKETIEPLLEFIKQNTQLIIDITVPMKFVKGSGMVFDQPEAGCMAKAISELVSPVPVVGAFKTISSHALLDIQKLLNRDTFVFGPEPQRTEVMNIISKIETLRPINAGPIREGETIERLVPFLININRRYKVTDSGIKIIM